MIIDIGGVKITLSNNRYGRRIANQLPKVARFVPASLWERRAKEVEALAWMKLDETTFWEYHWPEFCGEDLVDLEPIFD